MGKGELMEYEITHLPDTSIPEPKQQSSGLGRNIARTASRAAESVLGLPGDVANAALGVGNFLTSGAPKPIPKYSDIQKDLPISLPTSQQVREFGKEHISGQELEPRSEGEALYDEVIGDLASFLIPVKGKIPFKGAIAKAIGGNAASWLTKQVGGGEGAQAGAKIGFNLLSGLPGGRKTLTDRMNENYKNADSVSKGASHSAKQLNEDVRKISKYVYSGHETDAKKFLKKPVESIENYIRGEKIGVHDAWTLKRDINSVLGDYSTPREARPFLKNMSASLNNVLKDYGKSNPDFLKSYSEAEDIFKGLHQTSVVSDFLRKNLNLETALKNPVAKTLFLGGIGGLHYLGTLPQVVLGVGAIVGAREGSKAIDLIKNSSNARKYYADTIKASLAGNVRAASRSLSNLDKEADKYVSSHPESQSSQSDEYEIVSLPTGSV